ncbi:PREDICTED: putative glycerol kinase 5 isoform X1 [Polistes canadensis]|uniref:putative glycerol kinase 5 isoform X1 n=1 Tax=Polistes canadensis TaxID=91411 RepID=UPI000718ED1D|nr:PREDICTED: putative glycerol kinase 5 isoform X1 [Polistes canadensis]
MRHIVALDVGTTTVRCHIIDENANTVSSSIEKVELICSNRGYIEIDPDHFWNIIVKTVKDTLDVSGLDPSSLTCFGISTQRGTFSCWNLLTGNHYHKFITWKDLRADSLVKEWNCSLIIKGLRVGAYILYILTRSNRFLAGSVWKFMNTQITLRLLWVLQHVQGLREATMNDSVAFGDVNCWLLYKLTGKHIVDVSSASATGLFDPFTMKWATWAMNLLKIPHHIFPEIVDTATNFGVTPKHIFGVEIPIYCCMADQAASLFGSGCFNPGDMKITMGTGTFVNVNTGAKPYASVTGLYPLVGWRIKSELVYIVEGSSNDTGILIEWAKALEIYKDVAEISDLANSVEDSDGVYFIPAFTGLQAPINNNSAAAGLLGVKSTTKKAHILRSLLESLVFRTLLLCDSFHSETNFTFNKARIDGGVSQNDFMMQLLADVTGLEIERPVSVEMSIFGVACCAGLYCGIWKNKEELKNLRKVEKIFKPNKDSQLRYKNTITQWKRAVDRFTDWY